MKYRLVKCLCGKPQLKIIVGLLAWMWLTIWLILPTWCRREPAYCDGRLYNYLRAKTPTDKELDDESLLRLSHAKEILNSWTGDIKHQLSSSLTLGVVSKRRPYPPNHSLNYLTQTISRLAVYVQRQSLGVPDASLFVCNVDTQTEEFTEAKELEQFVNVVSQQVIEGSAEGRNRTTLNLFEREKRDYISCLSEAAKRTSSGGNVVLLQDDAYPVENFDLMLSSVLLSLKNRQQRLADRYSHSELLFVKLYHQEAYRKLPWLIHVVVLSLLIGWITCCLLGRWGILGRTRFFVTIWSIFYCLTVLCAIGHNSLATVRLAMTGSMYLTTQESCCIPVVLYPLSSVENVVDYLEKRVAVSGYSIDHMLDQMPDNVHTVALMTDVNLIRHIGRYTTLRALPVRGDLW